ncbi:MAG TPA: hypothetical protein VKA74_13460, partial [Myxococcota bacterium]|nr:hypothetical protein [Myxococcota bacterium]
MRRDMLNDAFGYRSASVKDAWGETSRWSPETRRAFREVATAMLGKDAYRRLARTEETVQNVVSYAKETIIVRSVIVAVGNILSNGVHLLAHGIDPINGFRAMRSKFVEISQHVANQEEIIRLKADLAGESRDPAAAKRLRARIAALEDANARLSIRPLIEAGEFSTIAESLTE